LHVYSLIQTKFLVAIVNVWQSTRLELLLLTLRWYLSYLYMFVLLEIEVLMLVVTLLELSHHFIAYLSSWLLTCYFLMVFLWGLTLVFISLDTMVEYSCLYTLWGTLILISCIASDASLGCVWWVHYQRGRECTQSW
jgi:hypothetical protein